MKANHLFLIKVQVKIFQPSLEFLPAQGKTQKRDSSFKKRKFFRSSSSLVKELEFLSRLEVLEIFNRDISRGIWPTTRVPVIVFLLFANKELIAFC